MKFSDATLAAGAALGGRLSKYATYGSAIVFDPPLRVGSYGLKEINLFGGFGLEANFMPLTETGTTIRVGCSGRLNVPQAAGGMVPRPIFRLYQSHSPTTRGTVFDYVPEFTQKDRGVFPALGCFKEDDCDVVFDLQTPQNPVLLLSGEQCVERVERRVGWYHYFDQCDKALATLSAFVAELNPEAFPFATEPKLCKALLAARLALTGEQAGWKDVSSTAQPHNHTLAGSATKGNR